MKEENTSAKKKQKEDTRSFRQHTPAKSKKQQTENVSSEADNGNEASGWLNQEFSPERGKDKNE